MKFNNETLIITDPCYVIKDCDYYKWLDDDVSTNHETVSSGVSTIDGMTFEWSDTIYGDWSCTTYNDKDQSILGRFCADAGLVAIFKAKEIIKYNPEFFEEFFLKDWCVTIIRNFIGDVEIEEVSTPDGDSEIQVIGKGSINFHTSQTGL